MAKILLVEDDSKLARQVKTWLEYERHVVEIASEGDDALDRLRHYHFDLIILDWMLPGLEGIEVCKRLRERGDNTPVLMLSGKDAAADKISGLDGGADDYVAKPVHPKELGSRIRALLRRVPSNREEPLHLGELYLDPLSLTVRKCGVEISLQPKEISLLELFMRHPNELLNSEFIVENVWMGEPEASPKWVKVYVNKLRSKLDQVGEPLSIRTVYGMGYVFEHKPEAT